MRDNFYRNSFKLKNDLITFFKTYKVTIIILSCVFILGLITGIFTASNHSSGLELENIPDDNLISFLCGDKGSFSVFFSYLVVIIIAVFCIIFFNLNKLCALINYIYIFIRGYILGFTIFALISLFSFAGIINAVIIIIPFWTIINFFIILISSICIAKNRIIKCYGKHCYSNKNPRNFLILLCLLLTAILFLMCMCFPLIKITIIVN